MPKVDIEGLRYVPLLPRWAYSDEQMERLAEKAVEYDEEGWINDIPLPPTKRSIYAKGELR